MVSSPVTSPFLLQNIVPEGNASTSAHVPSRSVASFEKSNISPKLDVPQNRDSAPRVPRREHAPREFVEDDERKVPVQDAQVHRVAAWSRGRSLVSRGFRRREGRKRRTRVGRESHAYP